MSLLPPHFFRSLSARLRTWRVLSWVKNKYFIVLFVGIVWIAFFDKDSWYVQRQYAKQRDKLERTIRYYRTGIKDMDSLLARLSQSDSFYLEKYAREQYLLKRKGETIFIIPDVAQ